MDTEEPNKICEYCNKKLIPFTKRTNWISRKMHLSCWKKKCDEFVYKEMMDQYIKDHPQS